MHDVSTIYIPIHLTSHLAAYASVRHELCSTAAEHHSCKGKRVQSVQQPRHEWFLQHSAHVKVQLKEQTKCKSQ